MNFIKKISLLCLLLCAFCGTIQAQMIVGQDTLYGNEWINYNQKYYKISVLSQGVVSITYAEMLTALGNTAMQGRKGIDFRMFYMGKEIPMYVSTGDGNINSNTVIEFYARPNPVYIDQFMISDTAKYWFSPNQSFVTDISPYFLTWSATPSSPAPKRYAVTTNNITAPPAKENFYMATSGSPYFNPYEGLGGFGKKWSAGVEQGGNAQFGGFDARGFASDFTKGTRVNDTTNLTTSFVYTGSDAPAANVTARIRLYERYEHKLRVYFNGGSTI
jgi:hypothetical protein